MTINTFIDREILAEVAAESIAKAAVTSRDAKRWVNAIAKAVVEIENNPFMTWQPVSQSLLMLSERTGKIYTANGVCQCEAYNQGFPATTARRLASSLAILNESSKNNQTGFLVAANYGKAFSYR